MALDLDLELAGALVLDEDADIVGLREQIEERVDELLEEGFRGIGGRGRVKDLRERVELRSMRRSRADPRCSSCRSRRSQSGPSASPRATG